MVLVALISQWQGGVGSDVQFWQLVLSGFFAMLAMIIPGISGSMVLFLLGTYPYIIQSIKTMALGALVPVGVGAVMGGVLGILGVRWFIQYDENQFESIILGAIVGSVVVIGLMIQWGSVALYQCIGMICAGVLISYSFGLYGKR